MLVRQAALAQRRASRLDPTVRGLLWAIAAGLTFSLLNTVMRELSLALNPYETQFLRYLFGVIVMVPFVLRTGLHSYWPKNVAGQFVRGGVHTAALYLWFMALPHITLAETTAIGFTTPIFIMLGAAWFLGERMRWERWVAAAIGLAGVLIVVAPKLGGGGGLFSLVMLASSPVYAGSYLITKTLTRYERPGVIVVWQAISVATLSLPLAALAWTPPTAAQWFSFALCGVLGSTGHYLLTRSFSVADISATQSTKFLELVWASVLGWFAFGDVTSRSTVIGGFVICVSTLWIARREARRAPGRSTTHACRRRYADGPPGCACTSHSRR
jgi:drug/metabolite transporter (DMT)-like permease